ncbi:hypothetical protein C9374_005456 [Naegleria lovaniensis]|uniref:Sulfhydryl oxidase n=1 Tax=Naegleria lovaniensis TaxID=51637 RepID=A0AA88GNG2_NAELO|nr:uncharacterized protein C9374_005456 [Naegleria lovaniensis]KAG2382254.1 hypothetical protein C9374_005456 [Naegleria lovaniensis]
MVLTPQQHQMPSSLLTEEESPQSNNTHPTLLIGSTTSILSSVPSSFTTSRSSSPPSTLQGGLLPTMMNHHPYTTTTTTSNTTPPPTPTTTTTTSNHAHHSFMNSLSFHHHHAKKSFTMLHSRILFSILTLVTLFIFVYVVIYLKSTSSNHVPIIDDDSFEILSNDDSFEIHSNRHTPVPLTPEEEFTFLENYKKKQINSQCSIEKNDGMLTREIIGPHVWNVFHAFIENYSDQDDSKLLQWIQLTTELFPCQQCSNDFRGILKKFPYRGFESYYKSKSRWMCKLHNLVNRKTHKEKLFDCDNEKELRVKYKLQKC